MIRINLLPPEMRVVTRGGTAQFPPGRIAFWAGGLVLLISVLLPLNNGLQAHRLGHLRREWKSLQSQNEKLKQVQEGLQALQRQAEALQTIKATPAKWAPRLALFSDALIPQMWLTHLDYTQGKSLRLEGSALVGSAAESDSSGQVTKLLQHLKEQPGFHQWFSDVQLESVQHRQIQNEDLVDFVLLLTPTG